MHTGSEHSVISGDKGKHQRRGSQKEFWRWCRHLTVTENGKVDGWVGGREAGV